MFEYFPGLLRVGDKGDKPHGFRAFNTGKRIDLENLVYQPSPCGSDFTIYSSGFAFAQTRAYRIKGLESKVKVFEVDHPATQKVKMTKKKDIWFSFRQYCLCSHRFR